MNKNVIPVFMNRLQTFKEAILELLYPETCVLCGRITRGGLCGVCKKKIIPILSPRCLVCGKQLRDQEQLLCLDCEKGEKEFEQGRSLWTHQGMVKESIHRFKYKNHRIYAKTYARLLLSQFAKELKEWKVECIIPVPIHKARRRQRGYNQAEVLARALHQQMEPTVPLLEDVLVRQKETKFQKTLGQRNRRKNLEHVFSKGKENLPYQRVLLIDDIYTTGATLQECTKILKEMGVEKVYFLTISIGQGF